MRAREASLTLSESTNQGYPKLAKADKLGSSSVRAREAASTVNTHDIWPKIVACLRGFAACLVELPWCAARLATCC